MKNLFLLLLAIVYGFISSAQEKEGMFAQLETNKGEILLELYFEATPLTVASFVGLAEGKLKYDTVKIKEPYYTNIVFHRVIDNFMIQCGDPTGTGSGHPGYKFYNEIVDTLKHDGPGVLAMANSGPHTNGSQFYITHKETPWLDGKYTVFGQVVEGQDVVNAVEQGDTLYNVAIIRNGKKARKFKAHKVFPKMMEQRKKEIEEAEQAKKDAFKDRMKEKYPAAKQTESGLMYIIETEGDGKQAEAGKKVKVHYRGTFVDGEKFDSSYDRDQPIEFPLGVGKVIKGWDEGIALLKEGSKAKLIIPYYLAYGEKGRGPIPDKADLIFDVELIEVME